MRRLAHVRLGIIADIHGNELALRAILQDADRLDVDRWWALGDLVLFGPRPAEVLELLGQPRTCGTASWLLLDDDGDGLIVTQRGARL
jgi:hypothetical protein